MPAPQSLAAFGQELYPDHATQALRLALEVETRAELRLRLSGSLPQPSARTRERIADKLIQRVIPIAAGRVEVTPYLRLAAGIADDQARLELIYWRTARTDAIIAAIAADIFHPFFIQGRPPRGYSATEFRMANTGALMDYDSVITRRFISAYARRAWDFRSEPTLTRALRILREVGLVETLPAPAGGARGPSFAVAPHTMRLATFVWCLYEEFAARRAPALAPDQAQNADFGRIFILRPLEVRALLEQARRRKLVRRAPAGALYSPTLDPDQAVERLLGAAG